jgi:hypothetical protein
MIRERTPPPLTPLTPLTPFSNVNYIDLDFENDYKQQDPSPVRRPLPPIRQFVPPPLQLPERQRYNNEYLSQYIFTENEPPLRPSRNLFHIDYDYIPEDSEEDNVIYIDSD